MPRRRQREDSDADLNRKLASGELDGEDVVSRERFDGRRKSLHIRKMRETKVLQKLVASAPRREGRVVQVHSLFLEVECGQEILRCVRRKTFAKMQSTPVVVGDRVLVAPTQATDTEGFHQGSLVEVLPRRTVLARAESFKGRRADPIVANADVLLIVASLVDPRIKWGFVDRAIVAAQGGGLVPVVCLTKWDLEPEQPDAAQWAQGRVALKHYPTIGVPVIALSCVTGQGIEELKAAMLGKSCVMTGQSAAGKTSLVRVLSPGLDLRVGGLSRVTGKGKHTTTTAKVYALPFGTEVVDTPGVKSFGLWQVDEDLLDRSFADLERGDAPDWRQVSYDGILEDLGQ